VSEIPFVQALGDAFDAAIAAPAAPRRALRLPRRRLSALAAAAALLAGGTLAVAHFLASPEKLASTGIACYDRPSLDADVSVPGGVRSPLEACAALYRAEGRPVPQMVACASKGSVAVFPGRDPGLCERLGLSPLPAGYGGARSRVQALQRDVFAIERSADCIAPSELVRRVQAVLDSGGWAGWHAERRADLGSGPCGSVSGLNGDGSRSIEGALDADHKVVFVSNAPYRSTQRLLYGASGIARQIEDTSGSRCFSPGSLEAAAAQLAAPSGRAVSFDLTSGRPAGEQFMDAREARYRAGCTVATDVTAAADGRGVVVTLLRRR
jgi:hypothetical protein